jgi:soluble lytic murein transglycosylase-like protein
MTFHQSLRTIAVASLGLAALGLASVARAEGGEGSNVIPPEITAAKPVVAPDPEETASISLKPAPLDKSAPRSPMADILRATALKPLIVRYALQHQVPYELADAVIRIESRYNTVARNGPNLGLTQLNFRTAQSLGYTGEASGLFDAETNLRFGLKYLAQAYQLAGGDLCGAILRYQGGHRAVTMTNASRVYCAKVKTIIAKAE